MLCFLQEALLWPDLESAGVGQEADKSSPKMSFTRMKTSFRHTFFESQICTRRLSCPKDPRIFPLVKNNVIEILYINLSISHRYISFQTRLYHIIFWDYTIIISNIGKDFHKQPQSLHLKRTFPSDNVKCV